MVGVADDFDLELGIEESEKAWSRAPRPVGIYRDISNAEYHADKTSYSSSLIKKMDVPAIAKYYMDSPQEYKDEFRIGSAIHKYILENDDFHKEFLTGIDCRRSGAVNKAAWAQWFVEHGAADGWDIVEHKAAEWYPMFEQQSGKSMVTPAEIEEIRMMAESVYRSPNAKKILDDSERESSIYWQDEETGLNLRIRPDSMNDRFIGDIKSIASVDDYTIDSAYVNLGYDVQDAMYTDGAQRVTGIYRPFIFIFVQKTAPYLSRCINMKEIHKEEGWNKYRERVLRLAECLESGDWPGLPDDLDHGLFVRRS